MTDAAYVLSGWALTGTVLAGYLVHVWVRTRRAKRLLGPGEGRPWR